MSTQIWSGATNTAWSTAGNWSVSVPVNADVVVLSNNAIDVASGLAQSAVTLGSFTADQSYTGLIGLATSYLNIGATTFNIGGSITGGGNGSRRMNINAANSGAVFNIYSSANSAADATFLANRLLCTAGVLNVMGGSTGVATATSETSTVATLTMTGSPTVVLGAGNTLTTGSVFGGTLTNYATATTVTLSLFDTASYTHRGTCAHTTLNVGARSTANYVGSGTITTANIAGTLDLSAGTSAVTITNCTMFASGRILDPNKRAIFTNPILLSQCRITDVTLNAGYGRTVQIG